MNLQLTPEIVFNGMISIALFFISMWFRRLDNDFDEIRKQILKIERDYQSKELATVQQRHSDHIMSEIRNELREINRKIDQKADKL